MNFETIDSLMTLGIGLTIIIGLFALQIIFLRWVFRINDQIFYLKQIRDLLNNLNARLAPPKTDQNKTLGTGKM